MHIPGFLRGSCFRKGLPALALLLLSCAGTLAQSKSSTPPAPAPLTAPLPSPAYTYRDLKDTSRNSYLTLVPAGTPRALIVFLPGFGNLPHQFLRQTKIPERAARNGYLVIVPNLYGWNTVYTDSASQERLNDMIQEVMDRYKIWHGNLILAGNGLGGSGAILYAEMANTANSKFIKPRALIGIDPPLDLERAWSVSDEISPSHLSVSAANEAHMLQDMWIKVYHGGLPSQLQEYRRTSAYSRSLPNGGNAAYLRSIPIHLYGDPDISWWLDNAGIGIEKTNIADNTALVAQLRLLGNTQADFVSCLGKGFGADGRRQPGAASMVDPEECVQWINHIMGN